MADTRTKSFAFAQANQMLVTIIAVSILLMTTSSSCLNSEIQIKIDKIINENFVPKNHITGLGLTIVSENGENIWAKGYGLRDVENSINATEDSKFFIASISKSFTAVLVVKTLSELYPEKGGAVLDIPIRKLYPEYNFTLSDRFRSESTTFRDMLAHRTCLVNELWGSIIAGSYKTVDEFLFRLRFAPEECPIRTDFEYNNAIVALAGEIIAAMANSTLPDMFTKLFEDIGMTSSTVIRPSDDYGNVVNISRGYYRKDGQTHRFNMKLLNKVTTDLGSGGVVSTPNDMAKYLLFHLNKGKVGSKQIVSEEAMSWMLESANKESAEITFRTKMNDIISGDFAYGLGFSIGIYDGWQRISHGGYIPPYNSLISFYPALGIGIFTSTSGPGRMNPETNHEFLHNQIFQILTGKNVTVNAHRKKILQEGSKDDTLKTGRQKYFEKMASMKSPTVEVQLENFTGLFGNALSGEIVVTIVNGTGSDPDRLYFRSGEWATGWLNKLPDSNTTFSLEWDSDIVHEMYTDLDGGLHEFLLDYSDINKPVGLYLGDYPTVFERDLTIDKLPIQPWDPDSCGPTQPSLSKPK